MGSEMCIRDRDCPGIAIMPCIVHGTMRVDVTVDTVGRFSSTMCGGREGSVLVEIFSWEFYCACLVVLDSTDLTSILCLGFTFVST